MPVLFIVTRPNKEGCEPFYVHCFTDRNTAHRFAQLQEIPNYEVIEGLDATKPDTERVAYAQQESGTVNILPHYSNQEVDQGLKDPFLDHITAGKTLWHVNLLEDGSLVKAVKAYSLTKCSVHKLPMPGESVAHDWPWCDENLVVHCFAYSSDRAVAISKSILSEYHKLTEENAAV